MMLVAIGRFSDAGCSPCVDGQMERASADGSLDGLAQPDREVFAAQPADRHVSFLAALPSQDDSAGLVAGREALCRGGCALRLPHGRHSLSAASATA